MVALDACGGSQQGVVAAVACGHRVLSENTMR